MVTSPNWFQSLHPPHNMLSSKKSIFHVGEEGGDHNTAIRIHAKKILAHRIIKGVVGQVRSPVEGHVGLRIAIQQHIHGSNIVLKPMVNPCKFKELLKACYLCKKVLRPNMDVYMYRYPFQTCLSQLFCTFIFGFWFWFWIFCFLCFCSDSNFIKFNLYLLFNLKNDF